MITAIGYGGFLLGPALIGGLADTIGLRMALGTIIAIGSSISVVSLRISDKAHQRESVE